MSIKGEVEKNDYLKSEGSFTAKLTAIKEQEGNFGPSLRFTFEVLNNPENEGLMVTGLVSKKVTPDNKTATWIKALDPSFELEIGKAITFDSFIGKVCRILVEEKGEYCNVVKCRALKSEELSALKKTEESKKVEEKPKTKSAAANDDIDF